MALISIYNFVLGFGLGGSGLDSITAVFMRFSVIFIEASFPGKLLKK